LNTYPYKVLFFPNQILTLIKKICLHSKPKSKKARLTTAELYKIGTALFSVADLVSRESERIHSSISDLDRIERIAIELITSAQLARDRRLFFDVARSKYLYVHEHQEASRNPPVDYLRIDKTFQEQVGITIQQFFEIGLAATFYYQRFRKLEISEYPAGDFIVLDIRTWLEPTEVPNESIDRFIEFLSIGLDEFKTKVSKEDTRSLGFDFLLMKEKPLLKIRKDAYILSFD
jgi:hypothetical protein